MKNILILGLIAVGMGANAQTKLISHKSHSGGDAEFRQALANGLSDIANSNFGVAPVETVRTAQLDTVIFISATKSVMITSTYCKKNDYRRTIDENDKAVSKFWNAGNDTVFNHPLFSKKHSLDSIRQVLKSTYYFKNDIDKVVFIGFDNKVKKYKSEAKKKKGLFPVIGSRFPPKATFILVLLALSCLAGYFCWRTHRLKALLSHS